MIKTIDSVVKYGLYFGDIELMGIDEVDANQRVRVEKMKSFTIGQLAKHVGIGVETVRFYEKKGLIRQPSRRESGYRKYSEEVVQRLQFIQQAKGLGFTLHEIQELLALSLSQELACDEIRAHAETKIRDIEARIASLEIIKSSLQILVNSCIKNEIRGTCPIIEVLEDGHTPFVCSKKNKNEFRANTRGNHNR